MKAVIAVVGLALAMLCSPAAKAWNCPSGQIRQQAPAGTPTSTPYYDVVEGIAFICVPTTPPTTPSTNSSNSNSSANANSNSQSNSNSTSGATSTSRATGGNASATGGNATATGGQGGQGGSVSNSGNSSNTNTNTNIAQGGQGGSANQKQGQNQSQSQGISNSGNSSASANGNGSNSGNNSNNVITNVPRQTATAVAPTLFLRSLALRESAWVCRVRLSVHHSVAVRLTPTVGRLKLLVHSWEPGSRLSYCKICDSNQGCQRRRRHHGRLHECGDGPSGAGSSRTSRGHYSNHNQHSTSGDSAGTSSGRDCDSSTRNTSCAFCGSGGSSSQGRAPACRKARALRHKSVVFTAGPSREGPSFLEAT